MDRRRFLAAGAGALASIPLAGCAQPSLKSGSSGRVVVIGGSYAGATTAKYLRLWSRGAIEVILVDRRHEFVSGPLSNLVLGGTRRIEHITRGYDALREQGIQLRGDEVTAIDTQKKIVQFAHRYADQGYDRLVLAPGTDYLFDTVEGLDSAARRNVLQAWEAGPATVALRRQLESMGDGGVFVITVPRAPFPGPAAPYERACQAAFHFRRAKPRAKVIVLDANPDVIVAGGLFKTAWQELYPGMVEYRPNVEIRSVDAATRSLHTSVGIVRGDVLNMLPEMRAADIARSAGLTDPGGRWCKVNWLSMESTLQPFVHVLGDATLAAPGMQKSAQMANQQAKLAAAAITDMMVYGREPDAASIPVLIDASYSFLSDREAFHRVSVHRYDAAAKTMSAVPGAGGLSPSRSDVEGVYALAWAQNIWNDMLG